MLQVKVSQYLYNFNSQLLIFCEATTKFQNANKMETLEHEKLKVCHQVRCIRIL